MLEPADTSLDQEAKPLAMDVTARPYVFAPVPQPTPVSSSVGPEQPSIFKFNKTAFLATAGAVFLVTVLALAGVLFNRPDQRSSQTNSPSDFGVTSLPVDGITSESQPELQVESLSVNGQLTVNNSLVIAPTDVPANPTAGQIYYDKTTNQPYYYNGTTFVSLTSSLPSVVTGLGGATGNIGLGNGLIIANSQVGISDSFVQGLRSSIVNSLQSLNGDVTLTAGQGINVNGTTITNIGVTSITGANGLNVSSSTGSVTLGLPQNLNSTASPTFADLNLSSALSVANGGTGATSFTTGSILVGNGTSALTEVNPTGNGQCLLSSVSGPVFGSCTASGTITSGTSQTSGVIAMFDVTTDHVTDSLLSQAGSTIVVGGSLAVNQASAAYAVDVSGDLNVSGAFRVNGTAVCTSSGCAPDSGSGNYIQNGTSTQNSASFNIDGSGVLGSDLSVGGASNFSGMVIARNSVDSDNAFVIQNAASTAFFTADSSNTRVIIGDTPVDVLNFSSPTSFNAGGSTYDAAVGDFNGDGKMDMASVNALSSTVSVFLNSTSVGASSPTFSASSDFATVTSPRRAVATDINGDGKIDIVVASSATNSFSILLNNTSAGATTPTFLAKTDIGTTYVGNGGIATGDFNADGKPDVVVGASSTNRAVVHLNTTPTGGTTASFSAGTILTTPSTSNPTFATGDFNADGEEDIAAISASTVSIYRNSTATGATTAVFAARQDITTGSSPSDLAIADFNGDGNIDLAFGNYGTDTVSVLINTTPANATTYTMATKVNFPSIIDPNNMVAADFNGDGKVDVAVQNSSSTLAVHINGTVANDTTPVFTLKSDLISLRISDMAVADFNGDAKPDLVVANTSGAYLSVLMNTTGGVGKLVVAAASQDDLGLVIQGAAGQTADFLRVVSSSGLTVMAFDATGALKLTGGITAGGTISSPGAGLESEHFGALSTAVGINSTALGYDADAQGNYSIAVGYGASTFGINTTALGYNAYGGGNYSLAVGYASSVSPFADSGIAIGTSAVIGSGHNYSIVIGKGAGTTASNQLVIGSTSMPIKDGYIGNGVATTSPQSFVLHATGGSGTNKAGASIAIAGGQGTGSAKGGDINLQIAQPTTTGSAQNALSTVLGLSGSTGAAFFQNAVNSTSALQIANVSGTSLFTADTTNMSIRIGSTSFALTSRADYGSTGSGAYTVLADISGDGLPDIVNTYNNNSIAVYTNNGSGGFSSSPTYITGSSVVALASADFNSDGKADIVAVNNGSTSISVLMNNGSGSLLGKVDYTTGSSPQFVTTGDFNGDGKADIAVGNGTGTISVFINSGTGTFAAKVDYATVGASRGVVAVDMNSDGKLDLVSSNNGSTLTSVLLGVGNGTFGAKSDYACGNYNYGMNVGDLNGDGLPDLVTGNYIYDNIAVCFNNGSGGFSAGTTYTTGSSTSPWLIALADMNSDGKLDIVTNNASSHTSSIFLNNGNGTFAAKIDLTHPATTSGVGSIVAGDVNNDGQPDILVNGASGIAYAVYLNQTLNTKLSIASGPTTAGFRLQVDASSKYDAFAIIDSNGNSLIKADTKGKLTFNNDATLYRSAASTLTTDGAFTAGGNITATGSVNASSATITGQTSIKMATDSSSAFLVQAASGMNLLTADTSSMSFVIGTSQAATPNYSAKVDYSAGFLPYILAKGDFNGDGKIDIVTSGYASTSIAVLINNGDGTYAAKVQYTTPTAPYSVATGDFNGDGKADIAVGTYTTALSVFLNSGTGTFPARADYATASSQVPALTVADFNGDGSVDIAAAGGAGFSVFTNSGTGTFPSRTDVTGASSPIDITSADINADGKPDIAISRSQTSGIDLYMNSGTGTFSSHTNLSVPSWSGIDGIAIADLNGDGKLDIAGANYGAWNVNGSDVITDNMLVYMNSGSNTFPSYSTYSFTPGSHPKSISAGDVNGDGTTDLVISFLSSNKIAVLPNTNGTFGVKTYYTTGSGPNSVILGDLNADGALDIATANVNAHTISVFMQGAQVASTKLSVIADGGLSTGLQVKVSASATGDAVKVVDSTGASIFRVNSTGALIGNTLQGVSATGADSNGSGLVLAGGQGTGTGVGGDINFKIAKAGLSGSNVNALSTVATISGANGSALLKNATDSTTAFQVQNAGSVTVLGIDTVNNSIFSGIPDSASAIGFTFNTPAYTTAGAKLLSVQNNGSERFSIDKNGHVKFTAAGTTTVAGDANTTCTLDAGANDVRGTLTMVATTALTPLSCTITFANAFGSTPYSVAVPLSGITSSPSLVPSTTTLGISGAVGGSIGDTFVYNYFNPE